MHMLGESEFGTSFFSPEPMEGGPAVKDDDTHFGLAVHRVIWNPASLVNGLTLISTSIHSVVSGLRALNNDPKGDIYFPAPDDLGAFDLPFKDYPGINGGKRCRYAGRASTGFQSRGYASNFGSTESISANSVPPHYQQSRKTLS
jgi:hypothetical protein